MVVASMRISFAFFGSMRSMVVRVAPKEPKHGNNSATDEHEQHFGPLVLAFVELSHDDLAASDVNKCTTGETQECNVDDFVAFCDLHADNDPQRRNERKNSQEEEHLLKCEASPGESGTKGDSSGRFVDYNAKGKLECLFDGSLQAEGNALEESVHADGEHEDYGRRLADSSSRFFGFVSLSVGLSHFVIDDLVFLSLWQST